MVVKFIILFGYKRFILDLFQEIKVCNLWVCNYICGNLGIYLFKMLRFRFKIVIVQILFKEKKEKKERRKMRGMRVKVGYKQGCGSNVYS